MSEVKFNPDEYANEVIEERSLTMEDGRERGVNQVQQTPSVEEKPVIHGDDGDSLG